MIIDHLSLPLLRDVGESGILLKCTGPEVLCCLWERAVGGHGNLPQRTPNTRLVGIAVPWCRSREYWI